MAENVLETRIQLRYGTYSQWMNSDVILKQGEAAICAFPYSNTIIPSDTRPEHTPPAIGIKIGDGYSYFYQLPWVQAIAADVYSWAKEPQPPERTYTAQDIVGLQSFVENLIQGDVNVTIAPRIYSITRGTGTNINKYYLQYKENNEESQWIVDTSSYIDVSEFAKIVNWIGAEIDDYIDLADRTESHIQYDLDRIKYTDSTSQGQFVTAVSQEKGKINVTKKNLSFSDIKETLPVTQGGTGLTNIPENSVLVGNGEETLRSIPLIDTLNNSESLVTSYGIKSYIDNKTAGLEGAMHFIGESTIAINNGDSVNPQIPGYNFSSAQLGDVILSGSKEFVWAGGYWSLLGDEGSYAIKGSIKDVDIAPDAEIAQSKIANLSNSFNEKVDKIDGKQLSSNDFTDEFKQKLQNIPENAQPNVIEHILLNGNEIPPTQVGELQKAVNLQVKEFDDISKEKLDNIQPNAQVNKIEKIIFDGVEITPNENKTVSFTSNPHTEHENVIEVIKVNGIEQTPNANKEINIIIDQEALNLNVVAGAQIPGLDNTKVEVEQLNKKLQLERIAVSGDIKDLKQTADTYIILDCGSSTEVI